MFLTGTERRKEISSRVKQIRIEKFGESHGAQKAMARALGIAYTTYRGYEENRTNDEFLRDFAKKFDVPLLWLLCADVEEEPKPKTEEPTVFINPEKDIVNSTQYRLFRMPDDSMHPTIRKGAWVGCFQGSIASDDLNDHIVLIETSGNATVRRILIQDHTMIAIADNRGLSDSHKIHKKDIVGRVTWQFSVV